MPSTALIEMKQELSAKTKALNQVFDEAGQNIDFSKVKCLGDGLSTTAINERVKAANSELADLHTKVKEREELEGIAESARNEWRAMNTPINPMEHPIDGPQRQQETRSIGQLFVSNSEYLAQKSRRNWANPVDLPDLDARNAVFRTGAGWGPEVIRIPRVELSPQRQIAVIDHIPMLPTDQSAINFMEETTFTNNAAETAESTAITAADLIGEGALALTERTKPVEWLPVFIPVTMQQMEDVPGIEAYVDQRLIYMLRARMDLQAIGGNGATPNLEGTENVTGIQAQALGADSIPDAIYKLFTSIRDDGFAEPSVAFIRAAKWQTVRLLKTADGQYIWGHPSMSGPETIWGVPVVQTNAVTATKCIAGDYATYSALYTKRGITLNVSDSHSSYFTRGMLAIRADVRAAMVHFRPKAFGEVTGL